MRTIKTILFLFSISFIIAISGCTTSGTAIPQGGPTMAQVYTDAMQQSQGETLDKARLTVQDKIKITDINNNSDLTRSTQNEINNLFPRLPDPELVMYVYPHFVGNDQLPVPGYSTAFSMYDKVYYAMPGEVVN